MPGAAGSFIRAAACGIPTAISTWKASRWSPKFTPNKPKPKVRYRTRSNISIRVILKKRSKSLGADSGLPDERTDEQTHFNGCLLLDRTGCSGSVFKPCSGSSYGGFLSGQDSTYLGRLSARRRL